MVDAVDTETLAKAEAAAKAALTPETFDFALAVSDHNYPESDVDVYLDEKAAQAFIEIFNERAVLEERIAKNNSGGSVKQAEELERVDYAYHEATKELLKSKYTIHIRGISPERSGELDEEAIAQFPIEYTEERNPITGALVKTEVENLKREEYYAGLIRQAHIVSITAPNGAVDTDFSDVAKVQTIFKRLPFLARQHLDEAIQDATITADFYRVLADPVF